MRLVNATHSEMDGMPVVKIRVVIPPKVIEGGMTDKLRSKLHAEWTAIFERHARFFFVIDMTHESVTMFNGMSLVPEIVRLSWAFSERSDKQVPVNAFIFSSGGARILFDSALALVNLNPKVVILTAESKEALRPLLREHALRQLVTA